MNKYTRINKKLGNIRDINPDEVYSEILKVFVKEKYTDYRLSNRDFPLINAISRGGNVTPRILILNASRIKTAKSILIGKGLVFDSGGVQSKGDHMEGMFFDKLGAITVISYCLYNRKVPGIIFLTNNMPGPNALVQDEIIKAYDGTNVLISHTDAEGRLGLADVIAYAKELNLKANKISLATLTGAASYFTGDNTTALLHTDNKELKKKVIDNDKIELWPAPTHKLYKNALKTRVLGADIQSCGKMKGGGSQTAYEFLKHFDKRLIHIDMAAMGVNSDNNANGWGLRELDFVVKELDK